MSEYNDIAGSDDVISLNYESQETFNEHSFRMKQSANRFEKHISSEDLAKENQKPIKQVDNEESDIMQAETQTYSFSIVNNGVTLEQPPSSQNTLTSNNPVIDRPPLAQSTLTEESSISVDKDSLAVQPIAIVEETTTVIESTTQLKVDINPSGLDTSSTTNNLRLYVSPSASLETTNVDDAQPNPDNEDLNDKPKEEPMDTSDAQASLGSDGIIEQPIPTALLIESNSTTEKSSDNPSPTQSKNSISPVSKGLYALSQPATNKFDEILAKLTSPARKTAATTPNNTEANVTIREEEELFIKESISKIVRRYAVKVDSNGRILSRDLLVERIVEENTTTRIESWPPVEKQVRHSISKMTRVTESARKKPIKSNSPKRKTKSLKPTSTIISPKTSKSHNDDEKKVTKTVTIVESCDDEDDDKPTDDISGDEFIPTSENLPGQSLTKNSRVFARWTDGHFYPGIIGSINGGKYTIDFDDGGKRQVKANDIISQSYLDTNQNVMAQTQDGFFDRGTIRRLIKKKKTGKLGYIVEKDGKEKWYPLRFISLTNEQAEHLPIVNNNTEESTNVVQGKRKRASLVPQSPNKKTKSSIFMSPNKSQPRSTFTPTRKAKLFSTMYFLLTGFNENMDIRNKVQDSIESHGGKVLEKIPANNRRDNVYLLSDKARKTAKFFEAKKLDIPCINHQWIDESIEKGEVQDWDTYKLVVPEKDTSS